LGAYPDHYRRHPDEVVRRLLDERDGILAWLIDGLHASRRNRRRRRKRWERGKKH